PSSERQPRRLDRPDGPAFELDDRLDGIVDVAAGNKRLDQRAYRRDLADEKAAEVDGVRGEISERARARVRGMKTPGVEHRVTAPVLEVTGAEMADLAELTRPDQVAREPQRRHEAVVETAEMNDARSGDIAPDRERLVGVAPERLLAEDVLTCTRRGD